MLYYFSLGSNLGNRESYIQKMEDLLKSFLKEPVKCSSLMETAPVDVAEKQTPYLNKILSGYSNLGPEVVLKNCQKFENKLGRLNKGEKLSRTADIDIIFAEGNILNQELLVIPHPAICERRFILEGLFELDPYFMHPVLNKNISSLYHEMSREIKDQEIRIIK